MNRYAGPVIALILAAGIQGNWPRCLIVFGARPDLMLVVLIAYSLAEDPAFGATLGFIAGLIQASAVDFSFGSFIVTRTITGFLAGSATTRLFNENPIVPVLSAAGLTLVCESMFLLANPRPVVSALGAVLGECVYNAVFALIVYWLIRHFETRHKIKLANARSGLIVR